jgi:5-methylcytosine-specific restriction endonuclease McrA
VEWNGANRELKRHTARKYYLSNWERAAQINAVWRAANPAKVREMGRASAARRRARKRGALVEKFDLDEIWQRDGGICWLCEIEIHPDLRFPDPLSVSLDHRIPLSRGGAHSRENCALAHLGCNKRKAAREIASPAEFALLLAVASPVRQ